MTMLIPLIIFSIKKFRQSNGWLFSGALIGMMGIIFNRINVGGLVHLNNLGNIGKFYFPTWIEVMISVGVVSAAMLVFFFFVENFKVWEKPPRDKENDIKAKIRLSGNRTYYGTSQIANRTRFSLVFVIAFGLGFALISVGDMYSDNVESIQPTKARGGDTLFIDGNKDGYGVAFTHAMHSFHRDSSKIACGQCHHMNLPNDQGSGCYECHNDMYFLGDGFKHDWHASKIGANLQCFDCHTHGEYKTMDNAKTCIECHEDLLATESTIEIKKYTKIASYVDAMHKMCIDCHEQKLEEDLDLQKRKPNLALCKNCHPNGHLNNYSKGPNRGTPVNEWLVIPSRGLK